MTTPREIEIQLAGLFKQDAVGVAVTETQTGRFVSVNKKYAAIVGYSLEQLLNMTFQEISEPEDLRDDNEKLHLLVQGEIEEYSLEKRYIHSNGSLVWAKLTVYLLTAFGGEDGHHVAILEEITSRKLLEMELAEKNRLLESVIMQSPVPTTVIRAPGRELLYVNDAALKIAGIQRSLMELQLADIRTNVKFFTPDGIEYTMEETALFHALNGIETRNKEAIIEGIDGTRRWVSGSANPIYNEEGEIIAAVNIFPDITERKMAEDAIRESERRYRIIMEASPDPIVQYDMEGNVLYINPAFTRVFGWTSSDLLGKKIPYVPEDKKAEKEQMLDILKKGEEYSGFSTSRLDKDGNEIEVVLSWGTWRDQGNNLAGSIVLLRDTTEENMLKRQLLQAQKMESLGVLAGGIAHDFNNILSPIIGYSQMLRQEFEPGDKKYKRAASIFDAGTKARELANQILTFSRKSNLESMSVKPQVLLREVLDLCRSTIPHNVTLTHAIKSDCDAIYANPTQFHQIVLNLVINACHAVGKDTGDVIVQLDQVSGKEKMGKNDVLDSQNHIVLTVTDSGVGIDSGIIDNIFDPYFTTKGNKGTGLGLSIVYGIVKELGGHISVDSEPGNGTTFSVIFPVIANECIVE